MDSNIHLIDFSNKLEKSCLESIEQGYITKDLSRLIESDKITVMNTESFIINIAERLKEKLI